MNTTSLKQFLASISTISGDLSNITAPPFVLADRSAVELPAFWGAHPDLFAAPALEPDPQERARLVLKWYLACLKGQQYATTRGGSGGAGDGVKKPLNPFLGECFLGSFKQDSIGETRLISEQVSHHPPVTACYLSNTTAGISAVGAAAQEVTLSKLGSVHIKQYGHAVLHIPKYDEYHLVTLPSASVKGLLSTPYPELDGGVQIVSSSGYHAKIEFEGRSLASSLNPFSGSAKKDDSGIDGDGRNSFHATLLKQSGSKKVSILEASGQWNAAFSFTQCDEQGKRGNVIESFDTATCHLTPIQTAPVSKQDSWESRRAWEGVIDAIHRGDMHGVAAEKSKVENAQRQMRTREQEEGKHWNPAFFLRGQTESQGVQSLINALDGKHEVERVQGVWNFVGEDKLADIKAPLHGSITPLG